MKLPFDIGNILKPRVAAPPIPSSSDPDQDDEYYMLAAGNLNDSTTTSIQSTTSTTNRNRALDTDVYGGKKITYTNRFDRLHQLSKLHIRIGLALKKLGLKIGKGYRLSIDSDLGIPPERQAAILAVCKALDQRVNMDKLFCIVARLAAKNGTVALLMTEGEDDDGTYLGIKTIENLPIKYTTLLTANVQVGAGIKNQQEREKMNMIMGDVIKVVLNENQDEPVRQIYNRERVALISVDPEDEEVTDIYGRNTLGIYGVSLLELLDNGGTIKNYLDTLWGFARALGKHGYGRLLINDKILEWELQNTKRSRKSASKLLSSENDAFKKMGPEEHIVGAGIEANNLAPTISEGGGIITIKESYEKDISYAFLETETGSNKAAGTTYAASYVASNETTSVIESTRREIKRAFEREIYARELKFHGFSDLECKSVRIELDPLDDSNYNTLQELIDLQTLYPDKFSPDQLFSLAHIRPPPPATPSPTKTHPKTQGQGKQQVQDE